MVSFATVVVAFAGLVVAYSAVRYLGAAHNNLVEARERCNKAWSDVDVLLERRMDEVESLVDVTREHVAHERDVLDDVVEARERVVEAETPDEAADALVSMRTSLEGVYDLSEEYPELRSNDRFDELTDSVRTLEQRLENRREQYNEAVRSYNARLEKVPERFLAGVGEHGRRTPFVASADARDGVDVGDRLDLTDD